MSPPLVHYTHFFWCESLTATLVALLFYLLDRFDRLGGRRRDIVAAAVVLGLLALTRQTWLYFAPVVGTWLVMREGRDWRRGAVTACLAALVLAVSIVPWSVRNTLAHGSFVLISTNRWFPVAVGALPKRERVRAKAEAPATPSGINTPGDFASELERERYWRDVALAAIHPEDPAWWLEKAGQDLSHLFSGRTPGAAVHPEGLGAARAARRRPAARLGPPGWRADGGRRPGRAVARPREPDEVARPDRRGRGPGGPRRGQREPALHRSRSSPSSPSTPGPLVASEHRSWGTAGWRLIGAWVVVGAHLNVVRTRTLPNVQETIDALLR